MAQMFIVFAVLTVVFTVVFVWLSLGKMDEAVIDIGLARGLAFLGSLVSSISAALFFTRNWRGDWGDAPAAVVLGAVGGFLLVIAAALLVDEIYNGFPSLRKIDRASVVKAFSNLCGLCLFAVGICLVVLITVRSDPSKVSPEQWKQIHTIAIPIGVTGSAVIVILSLLNGALLRGSYFFWRNLSEPGRKPERRCSVCGKTSNEVMKQYRRENPQVTILDLSWVSTCSSCNHTFCILHSAKVSDPSWGGEMVKGCPKCRIPI